MTYVPITTSAVTRPTTIPIAEPSHAISPASTAKLARTQPRTIRPMIRFVRMMASRCHPRHAAIGSGGSWVLLEQGRWGIGRNRRVDTSWAGR